MTAASGTAPDFGADLVLTNGRVWTGLGDDVAAAPRSIAISGGRVVEVGSADSVARWVTPRTRVIDVGGRRVVPGLIDSHLHAIRAGVTYLDELDWSGIRTHAAALDSIRAAVATRRPGEWITIMGGWYPTQFTDEPRMPRPEELTAVAPANPVFAHPLYGHGDHAVLNEQALQALGWTGSCPDPEGGVLGRRADGSPDGTVVGLGVYQVVGRAAMSPDPRRAIDSSRALFERLAAVGLTGVIDAGGLGMSPEKYHPVWALWREGGLPIRVRVDLCPVTRGNEAAEVIQWQEMLNPGMGDDLLAVLGVGEVLNYGAHDWEGMEPFAITDEAFALFSATLEDSARRRWPVTVHAVLDTSITRILDAMESVASRVPIDGLRWNLCHAESISRSNLERVKRLGLGLALQGRLTHKSLVAADRWGSETLRHATPFKDILELGIPFGAGTDGTRAASYNPWLSLWWFVTGRSLDGGPARDAIHLLDRDRALDAYTRGSAWLSFEDEVRGVIRPGAHADIAVLDGDYFTISEDEIPTLGSDLTLVAGRVVHRTGAFEALPVERHPSRPGPRP